MNSLILVVEDQPEILFNIKMTLEFNNYRVLTASNGKEAINILSEADCLPDLIISDIMMPEMDGYEFFETLSNHPTWALIPFVFLSARATPEDIRLGKILGADDYITKPFDEEDLLAVITGKLKRVSHLLSLGKVLNEHWNHLKGNFKPSLSEDDQKNVWLLYIVWDEDFGPKIQASIPEEIIPQSDVNKSLLPISIQSLGLQLYQAAVSIYGWEGLYSAQGLLLNIENIKKSGYIFFDSYLDSEVRGGRRQFMLTVISPRINYFESLKIKECLQDLSTCIKDGTDWKLKNYWTTISKILTISNINSQ